MTAVAPALDNCDHFGYRRGLGKRVMQAECKWTVIDNVLLHFGTAGPPSEEDWAGVVQDLKLPVVKRYLPAIIATEPNSVQRKAAIDVLKDRKIRVGLVTDDKLVRGMSMAAAWFGVEVKAFAWKDIVLAFRYLDVPSAKDKQMLAALDRLKAACASQRR